MSRTTLKEHKQDGKSFSPPFANMGISNSSWKDERLPNMLWAVLLIANLPRNDALNIFRRVIKYFQTFSDEKVFPDVTLYGLANMPVKYSEAVLREATAYEPAKVILSSLLHYDELPGREIWSSVLGKTCTDSAALFLMKAVGATLWHQSQEATDCRWLRIMPGIVTGRDQMPEQLLYKFANYPNEGDMREVRPMIRANEMAKVAFEQHIGHTKKLEPWVKSFWAQNLRDFPCFPLLREEAAPAIKPCTTLQRLNEVYQHLIHHAVSSQTDTGIDARHDTTFGMGLYSLSILRELLSIGNSNSIIGRLGLRTMLECYVTLAYLTQKAKPELWKSHRVFGAGQAKLSSLKLEELKSEKCFADVESLKEIANEDIWEEFLSIDVGHWEDSSLRREAVEAGVKAEYDKYYAWTSTFAHAHWGSVRESVFQTCGNPLHRLHRIPRTSCKTLPDVIPDACELVDKILELISKSFPTFPHRITIAG